MSRYSYMIEREITTVLGDIESKINDVKDRLEKIQGIDEIDSCVEQLNDIIKDLY